MRVFLVLVVFTPPSHVVEVECVVQVPCASQEVEEEEEEPEENPPPPPPPMSMLPNKPPPNIMEARGEWRRRAPAPPSRGGPKKGSLKKGSAPRKKLSNMRCAASKSRWVRMGKGELASGSKLGSKLPPWEPLLAAGA